MKATDLDNAVKVRNNYNLALSRAAQIESMDLGVRTQIRLNDRWTLGVKNSDLVPLLRRESDAQIAALRRQAAQLGLVL